MTRPLPQLSLYVHIPWCVRKCPYCDFNSHERKELPEQAYVQALMDDLDQELEWVQGRKVESVFFGGGTPSLFSPEAIAAIIDGCQQRLVFDDDVEITLEANPGTVEAGKFEGFRQAGVNRLSIGIQSFNADMLPRLGRIHGPEEAIRAAEMAHKAGFADAKGFNLDLMFGLPGQSVEQAEEDILTALSLSPSHLSHYQLTLEPGTAFFYRPPALPKDDDIWEMQTRCQQHLSEAGFAHYEVSAYAPPGRECQHNLNYWQFGDYLGIGAGAHGKLSRYNDDTLSVTRRSKLKTPDKYLRFSNSAQVLDQAGTIPGDELAFEFMMNALRLRQGFEYSLFEQRTGQSLDELQATIDSLCAKELLQKHPERLAPSDLGWRYLNEVMGAFL